jgi:predicted nuclease of predicted toxin-antitoxin system
MKVLLDLSAGQVVSTAIRSFGYDTVSVRDVDQHMADIDILAWAVRERRLVVTMDKVSAACFQPSRV